MKPILGLCVFLLYIGVLINLSCQKELSCDGCGKTNQLPIAVAGQDQVIILPTDSIFLDGSASKDPDGKIKSFSWRKISGPASYAIATSLTATTVVKNLEAGVYKFELKVTDNIGLFATDTVAIMVDNSVVNHPPIANAGKDTVITLPNNVVELDGSGSTDQDNNIASYSWTKVSGPSSFNIANANVVKTQLNNLVQGIYQFKLKVTDTGGLITEDTVQVTVQIVTSRPNCDVSNRPVSSTSFLLSLQLPDPRYDVAIAVVGSKILIAGGYTNNQPINFSSRVDIYDVATGQWTFIQLSEASPIGTVAILGTKVFFAGDRRKTIDIYDVSANTWSKTQLSQARHGMAGGVIGNKVFFAGGLTYSPIDSIYATAQISDRVDIYDAATNSMSTASLSEERYCTNDLEKITVTVIGNKIFFSGGSCNTVTDCSSNRIDIYDVVSNTWSYEKYMAKDGGSMFSGIAVGNKNYRVTGDYWKGGNILEIRDEIMNTTSYECLSGTLYRSPVSKGNKLVFPVSTVPQYTLDYKLTNFDIYDLATNSWSISNLPQPGINLWSFISVNNEVYAFGGTHNTNGLKYDKLYKLEF